GGGRGKTDTDCIFGTIANCFPADSYDVSGEYSRVSFIPTGSFFAGGTMILPKLKLNFNPFVVYTAGRPFNIVTGRDTNGDGLFTERPAFVSGQTDPANLRQTRFGDFDLSPAVGQELIPRNYGMGPGFFSVNMGISRSFQFGNVSGPAGGNKPSNAPAPEKRYTLTLSVQIQNLLNHTNLTNPIGNLSSPNFGQSISTAGGFGGPGGSSAAGNRRIQVQVRLGF
ncbi:MAG TPA: hypothetical protein VN843_04520, partial [Anaerolineales bacterium]|nr:hypothetical protein [Anaerolineales bacterium]